MEFEGTYLFLANRQHVWRALNDTEVLKTTIPGCEFIEWKSPSSLELVIRVNLGIIKPKFSGELELNDVKEAQKYRLLGRGHGRLLGLARGEAQIELSDHTLDENDLSRFKDLSRSKETQMDAVPPFPAIGTILDFRASGGASKNIMALGHKLVDKSARRIIDGFMNRFSAAMNAPVATMSKPVDEVMD